MFMKGLALLSLIFIPFMIIFLGVFLFILTIGKLIGYIINRKSTVEFPKTMMQKIIFYYVVPNLVFLLFSVFSLGKFTIFETIGIFIATLVIRNFVDWISDKVVRLVVGKLPILKNKSV
jgi:hypothetical protein